jgi:hypothetical protein
MSENKLVDIKGLLDSYEFPYTLPGDGQQLLIKPITTGQMKRVLVYENESDPYIVEVALDKLISDCVVTPDFDIDSLYLQDRFSLLLEIRKVTKGDSYQFNFKCPKCRVENIKNIKISELPVKPLDRSDNIITINDKLQFEVDFSTRANQKAAITRARDMRISLLEQQVEVQMGTFASSVVKVHTPDGILDDVSFEDKMYILNNISSDLFETFTKWFTDHEFGVEFTADCVCMSCENKMKLDIPLSDFFV